MLDHGMRLDPRHASLIPPAEQDVEAIASVLDRHGAGAQCHVIGGALDGKEAALEDALGVLVGQGSGFFISCIPGRLGYFESEEPGQRFLLRRAD
jgi:hypothetical protein